MADELNRMLGALAHRREGEVADRDMASLAVAIVGASRKRRRARMVVAVAGGTAAIAILGTASVFAARSVAVRDASPALPVMTVVAPNPSDEPRPSATPTPTPAADTGVMATLPPVAPDHGEGFPAAFEMRSWVWDHVGEGWTLETVGAADAVVDLVAPGGDRFRLATLGTPMAQAGRVVSWREEQRQAVIAWSDSADVQHAAELDLSTGDVTEIVFSMPRGETSVDVRPVAVDAAGAELWMASSDSQRVRYYRWGPTTGWTVASLSTDVSVGDGGFALAGDVADAVRRDGAVVVLDKSAAGADGASDVAFYEVDRDLVATATLAGEGSCAFVSWAADGGAAMYSCGDAQVQSREVPVVLSRAPAMGEAGAEPPVAMVGEAVSTRSTIGWKRPTGLGVIGGSTLEGR